MHISRIETFNVRWPFERLMTDAINLTDAWGFAVVRLHCSDGTVGTGYTGVARAAGSSLILDAIHDHYAEVLLGSDPGAIRSLWDAMYWSPLHWVGRAGVSQMALSAVDIALWDIAARRHDLPLCDLLGGRGLSSFPAYNTNGGWISFTQAQLVDNAKQSVDQGFRGIKMKLGLPDGAEDIRRVEAVRECVGPDIDLMTDVNQAWTPSHAIKWGRRLAEFDVKWLEEPMDPENWKAHARLSREIQTPLAVGEHLYSAYEFDNYIDAGAAGYLQPDATRIGGITGFLRVMEMAAAKDLPICPHAGDMMQVHQHLVFVAPTAHVFEHIPWGRELFVDPALIVEGALIRPTAPGAGTAMHDAALKRWSIVPSRVSEHSK
jgi:L-alanine-DL-glutamate epimerase-like enolase superfamily enzyme